MCKSIRRIPRRSTIVTALLVLIVAGCSSAERANEGGAGNERLEMGNLRTSIERLRDTLRGVTLERDHYKDQYLAAADELHAHKGEVEALEARYRYQFQNLRKAENELQQSGQHTGALQSQLQNQENQATALQDSNEKMRSRIEGLELERKSLNDKVASLSASQHLLQDALGKAEKELEEVKADNRVQTADRTSKIADLTGQVKRLHEDLFAMRQKQQSAPKSERKTVAAAVPPVTVTAKPTTAATPKAAAPQDPLNYVKAWWMRSVDEVRRGQWGRDTIILFGAVAMVALLALGMLFFMWRARRLRRRLRRARVHAAATSAAPLRSDDLTPIPPADSRVIPEAEVAAREMGMHNVTTSSRPLEGWPGEQASPPTQQVVTRTPAAAAAMADLGMTEAAPTMMLGPEGDDQTSAMAASRQAAEPAPTMAIPRSRNVIGAVPKEEASPLERAKTEALEDDPLLSDLKKVITQKFAEMRD